MMRISNLRSMICVLSFFQEDWRPSQSYLSSDYSYIAHQNPNKFHSTQLLGLDKGKERLETDRDAVSHLISFPLSLFPFSFPLLSPFPSPFPLYIPIIKKPLFILIFILKGPYPLFLIEHGKGKGCWRLF